MIAPPAVPNWRLVRRLGQTGDTWLADGKTFVDALPRRPIGDIMADFARLPDGDAELLRFVEANFDLPVAIEPAVSANPYIQFKFKAAESGPVVLTWTDDDGSTIVGEETITVS